MKVSERGQVTIPKRLRKTSGIDRNVEVEFVQEGERLFLRKKKPKRCPVDELVGTIKLAFGESVDDYIEQVRGR
jgi:AbrB family looped-hinge helix DNA binding protein